MPAVTGELAGGRCTLTSSSPSHKYLSITHQRFTSPPSTTPLNNQFTRQVYTKAVQYLQQLDKMVRTAQSAKKGRQQVWDEQIFLDHEGKQATRLRSYMSDPDAPDEANEQKSVFVFQIYHTLPLEGDIRNLVKYFGNDTISDGRSSPTWEIYDVQPDVFACVEHQRREIAHRKQSSPTSASPSPLIPKVVRDPFSDRRRYGFLILVDSDSYRDGVPPTKLVDPSGPLWVHFDRRFPQKSTVDNLSRLEDEPSMAKSVGVSLEEIEVLPEKLEMVAQRIQNTSVMTNTLSSMYDMSKLEDGSWDYGLVEDEGQPPNQTETETLSQQTPESSLQQDLELSSGPGDAVHVTSKSHSAEPDLRYIIYAPFLHPAHTSNTLENVAKTFSSSLISHLPSGLTIHLEFQIPPSPTLSTIISQHRSLLTSRPDFTIGALHTIQGQSQQRYYPCTRNESQALFPPKERYETFAVVLDKENFWEEQGVLFVMTDGGRFKPLLDEQGNVAWDGSESNFDEIVVLRSAGVEEVARRLGMLVLDENQEQEEEEA
jgi:hypothetical protein